MHSLRFIPLDKPRNFMDCFIGLPKGYDIDITNLINITVKSSALSIRKTTILEWVGELKRKA